MNTPKVFLFLKKNIEFFHKYCPTAYSPAISDEFVLEQKVRNSTWPIHIFHVSVALTINFYKVKSSRDTQICKDQKLNSKESGLS